MTKAFRLPAQNAVNIVLALVTVAALAWPSSASDD
jgi:hypothetical protein